MHRPADRASSCGQAPGAPARAALARYRDAAKRQTGCFDVLQHAQRDNHFTVVEHWQDEASLDEHVAAAHARLIATRSSR